MSIDWDVEPLKRSQKRNCFSCGEFALDEYLAHYAWQQQASSFTRTFVAVSKKVPERILGFYSLAAHSIDRNLLPPMLIKQYPKHPFPVIRLARLAVDCESKGRKLGRNLLMNAIDRILRVSQDIGCAAILVDAKHASARQFYEKYHFVALPEQPLTLWLPMNIAQKLYQTTEQPIELATT